MAEKVSKFSFFESFYEAAQDLDDGDRLAFYDAIATYAFTGEEPDFHGVMNTIWKLVKPNLDSSIKGQKTGGSGGRGNTRKPPVSDSVKPPVSETQNPPFDNPETQSKTDMDMDMDTDKDTDKEMDTEACFSLEKNKPSVNAQGGAAAAKAAPPPRKDSKPLCPLCGIPVWKNVQTRKWRCDNCMDEWADEAVVRR